jgi:hypothetical protein
MPISQKRLAGPTQISTVSSVAYTVPINTTTIVKQILITNTTGTVRTATVRLKPLNVSEANTHDILSNITVNPNETVSFNCSMVLVNDGNVASNTTSDQITFLCSANSALNVTIFGVEES